MKKQFLGVLLALCLCLTLLPTTALADTTTPDWTGWTELTAETTSISGGTKKSPKKYYLNGNVSISSTLQISGYATLDLNGYVLQMTGSGSVITVASKGNLTLQDNGSSTPHYFDSEWKWVSTATSQPTGGHTVNGGIITGGNAGNGGGVYLNDKGTLTMNGGSIVGCSADYGGGVFISGDWNKSKLTMKDGSSIIGCTATWGGGGVRIEDGDFTMDGGSIVGCSAGYGGGGVDASNGSFTMNGGRIEDCTAGWGGAVYVSNTLYANGGTINGDVKNEGTITRSGDATGYTTFNGEINGYGGSINDAACPYTVTFDLNGADGTALAEQHILKGQKAAALGAPAAPTGKAFAGWYEKDGETLKDTAFDFSTAVTGSTTLYAKWVETYTITFDPNGGALSDDAATTMVTNAEGKLTTLPEPTREGYGFYGWYTQAAGGERVCESTTFTEDMTIYAQWGRILEKVEFSLSGYGEGQTVSDLKLILNNSNGDVIDQYAEYGVNYFISLNRDGYDNPIEPSALFDRNTTYYLYVRILLAEGVFDEYINSGDFALSSEPADYLTQDGRSLTVSFILPTVGYTITFDPNGGTLPEADTAAYTTADGALTLVSLPTPTRSGSYRFDGWFTRPIGGTEVTVDTVFDKTATVYAHWTYTGSSSAPSYAVTVPDTKNGSVSVSPRNAGKGATVTITVTPDAGYTLETLTVLDRDGNEIELTSMGGGKYSFKMPAGQVTVEAAFMEDNTMLNFFVDVSADKYYYDAVLWAAENGITGGVDETHFGPDQHCTRAQLAAFLYRYAQLQGKGFTGAWMFRLPFTDVSDWCYEAVAWCSMNGIVTGYGDGLFGTDDDITREQVVTMLYRFAIATGMDVSVGEDTNILSYRDALDISDYALEAFQWACGAGIVEGADGALLPSANCTRAQIVTMLYRLLGE